MPAAAAASFTPAIAGISGTSVGASGDTAEDIINSKKQKHHENRVMAEYHPPIYVPARRIGAKDVDGRDKARPQRL